MSRLITSVKIIFYFLILDIKYDIWKPSTEIEHIVKWMNGRNEYISTINKNNSISDQMRDSFYYKLLWMTFHFTLTNAIWVFMGYIVYPSRCMMWKCACWLFLIQSYYRCIRVTTGFYELLFLIAYCILGKLWTKNYASFWWWFITENNISVKRTFSKFTFLILEN